MTLIDKARSFAIEAHGIQKYGDETYAVHLDAVADILMQRCFRDELDRPEIQELVAAAYLHDVLEDTHVTLEEIEIEFGEAVALLVSAVTDGPGETRRERKRRPYRMIPRVRWALFIKLADRIANVESAISNDRADLLAMYQSEHPEFEKHLRHAAHADGEKLLFQRLDALLGWP